MRGVESGMCMLLRLGMVGLGLAVHQLLCLLEDLGCLRHQSIFAGCRHSLSCCVLAEEVLVEG